MNPQRKFLLSSFVALFAILVGLFVWDTLRQNSSHFLAGAPPPLEKNQLVPKLPAIRPSDPMRGSNDASAVTVVEFADYYCDHCRAVEQELGKALDQETQPIRLVWRDLPIQSERLEGLLAAMAGRCAQEQGKFWVMHDALLASGKLDVASINKLAVDSGLNKENFSACMTSGRHIYDIQNDVDDAQLHHITGTPTIFVGSQVLSGTISADDIHLAIRRARESR